MSMGTWVTVLYSTSYTSGLPNMMEEFGETNTAIGTLGVTTYLFGLAAGSVIYAPLSELWGRRPIYWFALLGFVLLILPCALGNSLWSIIFVRFWG
jgi:MFS family permease